MSRVKITNKVYRLKHPQQLNVPGNPDELRFDGGQEFHIVADVLYMNGFPIPQSMQDYLIKWIMDNPLYFIEDTRNF